jgi:phytoene desaturase
MVKNTIIVGAGIAGLAAAIRMANLGYQVTIIDQNSFIGGKLHSFEKNNYRFDFGPSLFTMPQLVDELFTLSGLDPKLHFKYERLIETCHYFWQDGISLTAFGNKIDFAHEVETKLGVNSSAFLSYLNYSKNIYHHTAPFFLQNSLHQPKTFKNKKLINALLNIPRFDLFQSMHSANKKRLKHPKLVQLFDRFATYNGSNPYKAPGILNIISSLENEYGAFFPKNGMVGITESLTFLAHHLGVTFNLNEKVDEILHKNGSITGVKTNKGTYDSSIVISNVDMWFTYNKLLNNIQKPIQLLNQERSSSALVFYWGVKKTFSTLGLHNIFFSDDYKREFDALFTSLTLYEDPTIYINITSKLKPSDAPEGSENWFVMINVPRNIGQNWEEIKIRARRLIINKLNQHFNIDLEKLIECEEVTDPIVIEEKTGSYAGSLYGTSSNNKLAAFLRQKNNGPIGGLYFCGGSVHPGGGIPLCLWSAKIVTAMINQKYS